MICLDTNYLIMGLVRGSTEAGRLLAWSDDRERFCVSSVVWYEFICGPVNAAQSVAMRSLVHEIVPFDEVVAEESARLFNAVGRRRRLRIDAVIAATAVLRGIPLATSNRQDFIPFVDHGLNLLA